MGSFTCCIWWLIFGVLLGWLLSWWLSKFFGNKASESKQSDSNAIVDETPSLRETYFSESPPARTVAPTVMSRADMVRAASAVGISFSGKKNDLEIIEGIGPKIAELLNNNGIHTFAELGSASIATLDLVLEQGGDRFKLANPSTWAEQAQLAAENKWADLKALQDNLDGGIRHS